MTIQEVGAAGLVLARAIECGLVRTPSGVVPHSPSPLAVAQAATYLIMYYGHVAVDDDLDRGTLEKWLDEALKAGGIA